VPIKLGKLTNQLKKRPFVADLIPTRAAMYPFPIAFMKRSFSVHQAWSGLPLKLFHALIWLGWNVLDTEHGVPCLACGSGALRGLIGRASQTSNSDVHDAFRALRSVNVNLPTRTAPGRMQATSILQWHRHCPQSGMFFWQFSDAVADWCRGTGVTYAWLDLTVTRQLAHPSSLRLYEYGSALAGRKKRTTLRLKLDELRLALEVGEEYRAWTDLRGKLVARAIDKLDDVAPFITAMDVVPVANSRTLKRIVLTFKREPNWTPSTSLAAKPLSLEDLEYLPQLPTEIDELLGRHS
jgi:hypothetical protein